MLKINARNVNTIISYIKPSFSKKPPIPLRSLSKPAESSSFLRRLQQCTTREEFNTLGKEYQQARINGYCTDNLENAFLKKKDELKKAFNLEAKAYFANKMAENPRYIFNEPIFKTQFDRFIASTNGDYDLIKRLLEHPTLGIKANQSAFSRILNSTNKDTAKILTKYLNGKPLQKLENGKLVNLSADEIANVVQFNRNNKNIVELLNNPQQMTTFLQRSELVISNLEKYSPDISSALKYNMINKKGVWFNTSLNKNLLNDIEAIVHGQNYFPKFNGNISLSQIQNSTKLGDAISINGKMYLNNGKNIEELKISEEMYKKLFPPLERFNISQSRYTGDCFLISPLENAMNTPKGRCEIYKMFSQDKYGNLFLNTKGNSIRIDKLNSSEKELSGCPGLALIEREFNKTNTSLSSIAGFSAIGKNGCQVIHHAFTPREAQKILFGDFYKYINNEDYLLRIGFLKDNPKYNMLTNHAYSLKSFDAVNRTYTITNPHRAGVDITIPEEEFVKNLAKLDVAKI